MAEQNLSMTGKIKKSLRKIIWLLEGIFFSTAAVCIYVECRGRRNESEVILTIIAILALLGAFMPMGDEKPWRKGEICGKSVETLLLAVIIMGSIAEVPGVFCGAWYFGVSARALREMGTLEYLKERCLTRRFCIWCSSALRKKAGKIYNYLIHADLDRKSRRIIAALVCVNALAVIAACIAVPFGLVLAAVYSVCLYVIAGKYVSDLNRRYKLLIKALDGMAEGGFNVPMDEDMGPFEPLKPRLYKIQSGFKKAVDEEVKSQRMKAELITNVSHDLKTPLTAIITYVNLLKEQSTDSEKQREYLDTLERKSFRLKALIEDLFEVSKANSGNVTLNLVPVDILNLIKQVKLEMQDKLDEAGLDIRVNLPDEKIFLSLDSQKTYRIYENLFSNVAKYAMKGTRVYVNAIIKDDTVVIIIKNISQQEIRADAQELMERFVRGDQSRNTEGSGLGLAIAKSFAELQGGSLNIEIDGDLFKASTTWKNGFKTA